MKHKKIRPNTLLFSADALSSVTKISITITYFSCFLLTDKTSVSGRGDRIILIGVYQTKFYQISFLNLINKHQMYCFFTIPVGPSGGDIYIHRTNKKLTFLINCYDFNTKSN